MLKILQRILQQKYKLVITRNRCVLLMLFQAIACLSHVSCLELPGVAFPCKHLLIFVDSGQCGSCSN